MASNTIKIIKSDDWEIIKYEDFERSGHHLDTEDIVDLLKYLGYEVKVEEISDEEVDGIYLEI